MPTDFGPFREQITQAAQRYATSAQSRAARLADLRRALDPAADAGALAAAGLAAASSPSVRWNGGVFNLGEAINSQHSFGTEPARYALIASDGSQIMPDRHKPVLYAMIQVACVNILYGASPAAPAPTARAVRLWVEDELYEPQTGDLIPNGEFANERDLREIEALADQCEAMQRAGFQAVALADGSLVPFALLNDQRLRTGDARLERFTAALHRIRRCDAVVAGFIARPSNNALARACSLADIPYPEVPARLPQAEEKICGILDRQLLEGWLDAGRRTALFAQNWAINGMQFLGGSGHAMRAFYMNLGEDRPEIARIEMPEWCAGRAAVDLLTGVLSRHAAVGGGYPFCLKAAHEEAVLTRQDQREIESRLQAEFGDRGFLLPPSPKQESKERR